MVLGDDRDKRTMLLQTRLYSPHHQKEERQKQMKRKLLIAFNYIAVVCAFGAGFLQLALYTPAGTFSGLVFIAWAVMKLQEKKGDK